MTPTGIADYRNEVFRYYGESRYREALAAALEAAAKFPDYDAKTSFWIACLQTRLKNYNEAIQTLEDAVKRNVWWPAEVLRDSDLDPIRDKPEFKAIEAHCAHILGEQVNKRALPDLMVCLPAGYDHEKEWPALIVFHQRYGERPELTSPPWTPVLSTGMMLAVPWSSQIYAQDGRSWDNLEASERDITWAYLKLKEYRLDHQNIVVGGFSQGGALSIYSTFKRIIPCRGFVAVAPSDWIIPESKPAGERDRPSETFRGLVEASDLRGLRGVIMIGEKDPFIPKIQQLYKLMVEKGLDGRLQVETGLGHEYPENFGNKLRTAIDFVLDTGSKV